MMMNKIHYGFLRSILSTFEQTHFSLSLPLAQMFNLRHQISRFSHTPPPCLMMKSIRKYGGASNNFTASITWIFFSLFLRILRSWKSRFCYTPPTVLLHRCAKNRSTVSLFFVHQIFVLTVLCTNVLSFCTRRKKKALPVPTLSHTHIVLLYLFVICLPFKIASIPEPQTGHAQVHNTKNQLNFKQFTFYMPSFLLLRYLVLYSVKYLVDTPLFFSSCYKAYIILRFVSPKRNFFFCTDHANLSKMFQAGLDVGSREDFFFVQRTTPPTNEKSAKKNYFRSDYLALPYPPHWRKKNRLIWIQNSNQSRPPPFIICF